MSSLIPLFVATFLACLVEAVEATTIVLAAGTARNWRSALQGTLAALVVLAAIIAVAGPLVALIPIEYLRILVGGLLLVFGLQWIRKAVLRASGRKALHDEAAIYEREVAAARASGSGSRGVVADWYAFTLSFKGVLLEGLEVVFIVLTFGSNAKSVGTAALAAGAAVVLVVLLGVAVRGPLSRVPENTMKFVVGVMLTAFGLFWAAEGAGAVWPGADASLLVIAPAILVVALLMVAVLRRPAPSSSSATPANPAPAAGPSRDAVASDGQRTEATRTEVLTADIETDAGDTVASSADPAPRGSRLRAFGAFWYDFIVGDDWTVFLLVVVTIAATALAALATASASWVVASALVLAALVWGQWRAARAAH